MGLGRSSRTSPAGFSTLRCRLMVGGRGGNWAAISPAVSGPACSSSQMRRRVASATARKTPSCLRACYSELAKKAISQGSQGSSNPASARCRRSWRRARSASSLAACGPTASSASVSAEIVGFWGRVLGSSGSSIQTTDVSKRPLPRLGTRRRLLVDLGIDSPPRARCWKNRRRCGGALHAGGEALAAASLRVSANAARVEPSSTTPGLKSSFQGAKTKRRGNQQPGGSADKPKPAEGER